MRKKFTIFLILIFILELVPVNFSNAASLASKLKGKILLQVEDNGEGWYINPDNSERCYLGRPADAFRIMRELGLGISEDSYNSFNGYAPQRLAGKILLRVEANGEAYYVFPDNLKIYYLGRPTDAFKIMREMGLGITNNDLDKIEINKNYTNTDSKYPLNLIKNSKWSILAKVPQIYNSSLYLYFGVDRIDESMDIKTFTQNSKSGELKESLIYSYSTAFISKAELAMSGCFNLMEIKGEKYNNMPDNYLEIKSMWYEYPALKVGLESHTYYFPISINAKNNNVYMQNYSEYNSDSNSCYIVNATIQILSKAPFDNDCSVRGETTISGEKYYYTKESDHLTLMNYFKCFSNEEDAQKEGYTKAYDN